MYKCPIFIEHMNRKIMNKIKLILKRNLFRDNRREKYSEMEERVNKRQARGNFVEF
jgi:hypothetical protein